MVDSCEYSADKRLFGGPEGPERDNGCRDLWYLAASRQPDD